MREEFLKELRESLYVHRPLPLNREGSLEAGFPKKKVLDARPLYHGETRAAEPQAGGVASVEVEGDEILVRAPLRSGRWPEGAPADGDYCNFGSALMSFSLPREDWRPYNRLQVKPNIFQSPRPVFPPGGKRGKLPL